MARLLLHAKLFIRQNTHLYEGMYGSQRVIVKTAAHSNAEASILQEAKILSLCSPHPNIVPLLGTSVHTGDDSLIDSLIDGSLMLIYPYVDGGSLESNMRRLRTTTTEIERLHLVRDIALACKELESASVYHRDLKASNVLLDQSSSIALLSDFGVAMQATSEHVAVMGSPYHMAPELLVAQNSTCGMTTYSTQQEMYSFGVLAYEIISMSTPFLGVVGGLPGTITGTELRRRIVEDDYRPIFRFDNTCNQTVELEAAVNLVHRCWSADPNQRPSSFVEIYEELDDLVKTIPRSVLF